MKPWQFRKPKGPGFGISAGYYLSVLSTKPVMPPILTLINPKGEGGAVVGLGAPLSQGATKDSLKEPMRRGAYALATKDRKTVLKLLVMSKEEAGFDPEALAQSRMAANLDAEVVSRIRASWTLAQLTFESHDPAVYPAIRFQLELMRRLADLTDGVVADPLSQRYLLPSQVLHPGTNEQAVAAVDLVSLETRVKPEGLHAYTLGMQKLALPELEITGIDSSAERLASEFLLGVCQTALNGKLVQAGARLGSPKAPFEAQAGGLDRGMWEGVPVLELLPPTSVSATAALEQWAMTR